MAILIVEDELLVASDIQSALQSFGFSEVIIATNYTEAIDRLQSQIIYFAILDIQLSGYKTGIDVAHFIDKHIHIPFIFLSAFEDIKTLTEALATAPKAYLQKPFGRASLYSAVQLALDNFQKKKIPAEQHSDNIIIRDAFFIKKKNSFVRIPLSDIAFIQSSGNYLELNTRKVDKFLIRTTQKSLLEQLPDTFVKVHKSYIVNISYLERINQEELIVAGNTIPFVPGYREELLSRIRKFS